MRKHIKNISLILSIFIFLSSFLHDSIIVYAIDNITNDNGDDSQDGIIVDKKGVTIGSVFRDISDLIGFATIQFGAVTNGDFAQVLKNDEDFVNYWNGTNVTVDEDTGNINFSEELVSYIKKALQEYSEETNGFWLVPTMRMNNLNPTYFRNREQYITIQNLINNYGIIVLNVSDSSKNLSDSQAKPYYQNNYLYYGYETFYAADFSPYLESDYNFVSMSSTYNGTGNLYINLYDSSWNKVSNIDAYKISGYDIHTSFDTLTKSSSYSNYCMKFLNYQEGYILRQWSNAGTGMIISKDGCRVRVFKSENAMKLYDTGQRSVYFTEEFYNNDPKAITVAVDELENFMNKKYDQYIDDLRGLISEAGSNLTEADIEKLTAQVLGKLDENNGLTEEGNKINSYWFEKIYKELVAIDEMVSEKLDSIIEYIKDIKNWTAADTIIDGVDAVADIAGFIKDLLSDAEGVADTALGTLLDALDGGTSLLSKKFPFSLPWDMMFFVTLLASDPEVPHFEIPIDFSISALDINIHYDFVVDFTDFQYLSDICRTILSMTYCVGLIKLTPGIVIIKKEE